MVDVEHDPVEARKPDFVELSQELRRLGRELRSLSESQPDFLQRLDSLQNEMNSIACRFRRATWR
jgi:hypothetical protein